MASDSGDRPTLDTVAAAAGVSRMTVSNAYNQADQLSAATRRRILLVAGQLSCAAVPGVAELTRHLEDAPTGRGRSIQARLLALDTVIRGTAGGRGNRVEGGQRAAVTRHRPS